jgi:hypothetical protein
VCAALAWCISVSFLSGLKSPGPSLHLFFGGSSWLIEESLARQSVV